MGLLEVLGFGKKKEKIKSAIENGAIVIDVRSSAEYQSGHIDQSANIPLDAIEGQFNKWKKQEKEIIFCCASGMRSGVATTKARAAGLSAINGGGWNALNNIIS